MESLVDGVLGGCWWTCRARLSALPLFVGILPLSFIDHAGESGSDDLCNIISPSSTCLLRAAQRRDPARGQPEKYASGVGATSNPPAGCTWTTAGSGRRGPVGPRTAGRIDRAQAVAPARA